MGRLGLTAHGRNEQGSRCAWRSAAREWGERRAYFDEPDDEVPPLLCPPLLLPDEVSPDFEAPPVLLPDDMPPPDCELPLLLVPELPPSPLRWHAASEPMMNRGSNNAASRRFLRVSICMVLMKVGMPGPYFAAPELLAPPVELPEVPPVPPLVPLLVPPDDMPLLVSPPVEPPLLLEVPPVEVPELGLLLDVPPVEVPELGVLEVPPVDEPDVSVLLELVPPVDEPDVPLGLVLDVPPEVPLGGVLDAPPEVPLGEVLDAPPVPLDGVEGAAPGVCEDSDGGVDVAGAEELGVLLLVPPVAPLWSPPPRLQAAILTVSKPSNTRVRETCKFGFIAIPFN